MGIIVLKLSFGEVIKRNFGPTIYLPQMTVLIQLSPDLINDDSALFQPHDVESTQIQY